MQPARYLMFTHTIALPFMALISGGQIAVMAQPRDANTLQGSEPRPVNRTYRTAPLLRGCAGWTGLVKKCRPSNSVCP